MSKLVISRRRDESVMIGDSVIVTVISTRGNTVRLLIEAPKEVVIVRSELKRQRATRQEETAP